MSLALLGETWPAGAAAQPAGAADDGPTETIEEIIVTGSRIKRRDFNSPSPISTVDREAIAFTGLPTVEEVLNQMPQVAPDFGRSSNNPGDGAAHINLRGMGSGRTLVLLNGRRVAPSGTESSVDLNNIPQALIERVEIITGGATTVYGSDAVAGVVNFITRKDLSGLVIETGGSITEHRDAGVVDANVAWGHDLANGRGNVTLYAGYQDRSELFASERELTRVVLENDDETGTLFESGNLPPSGGGIPFPLVKFGDSLAATAFDPDGTPRQLTDADLYNYAPENYLQIPLTRLTGGIMASYLLDNGYELYVESGYSRNESAQQLATAIGGGPVNVNIDNPLLMPETRQFFIDHFQSSPGTASFFFGRRFVEVGPRVFDHERDYWRSLAGVRGELGGGWDFDAWFSYTQATENTFLRNAVSASRFRQGLQVDPATGDCLDPSGGCVPVDPFGAGRISEDAAAFIRIDGLRNDTRRIQMLASTVLTGSAFDLPAGSVDTAFGLEWRSDEASYRADDALFTGDALGYNGDAPVDGTERVWEFYGEARIPLARDMAYADYLGLEVGARYSKYQLAGGLWTYKAGAEWQPADALRLRVMNQRSARAPNNYELFQQQFTEESFFVFEGRPQDDPCSAVRDPVASGNAEKCIIQGLPADQLGTFNATTVPVSFIQGGNPELVPEVAKTWTAGAVITPEALPGWQFSVDWFSLEVSDSIGPIDAMAICFDPANVTNLLCDRARRDVSAGYNIVEIYQPTSNRGMIGSKGVDTQANLLTDLPDYLALFDGYARLSGSFTWTHVIESTTQLNPVSQVIDCAGFFGSYCRFDIAGVTVPENRVAAYVSYFSGPLNLYLSSVWIDGSTNSARMQAQNNGEPLPVLAIPTIGSKTYLDVGVGYDVTENIIVRVGVNNLTDTDAPLMPDTELAGNTDAVMYDVYGRSYYLNISATLWQ